MSEPRSGKDATTEARQAAVLACYPETINDTEVCSAAGISRPTFYHWIKDNVNGFADKLAELEPQRGRTLEAKMFDVLNWATEDETRYEKILRYPSLFMFALRGALPEKYGYKAGYAQEEARKVVEELMRMRDDPTVRVESGDKLEADLDAILGGR